MNKLTLLSVVLAVLVVSVGPGRRVASAAPPASLEGVKEKMQELDGRLEDVKASVAKLKERGEQLKENVGAKARELKELAEKSDTFSDDLKRRVTLLQTQDEAKQLEALKEIDKLASKDETVLALGHVAKSAIHESVRQKALGIAAGLGEAGYPVMAIAFDSLSQEDRAYLAVALNKANKTDDKLIMFALMSKTAEEDLMKTLLGLEMEPSQKLTFIASIAEAQSGDDTIDRIVEAGDKTPGEAGLLILYAVAKGGSAKQITTAVVAAAKRKEAAFPVLAAAFKKEDKEPRAAVVKAAKQLGGEAGEFIVKTALADPNAELRAAAEAAVK